MIRSATTKDVYTITEIYNYYIAHSHATFELNQIDTNEMQRRIHHIQKNLGLPWLILEIANEIVGYAYATQWKARTAYARTVESSIYLKNDQGGKGYGIELYPELLSQLRDTGYHAVIAGMSLPNEASQALHEKLGFKKIGVFKEVGHKFNRWVDVGYWELILQQQ